MEIHLRTLLKGILWESFGIITAFIVFNEWKPIGIYFLIRFATYYPFHRIFKKINFRRVLRLKLK